MRNSVKKGKSSRLLLLLLTICLTTVIAFGFAACVKPVDPPKNGEHSIDCECPDCKEPGQPGHPPGCECPECKPPVVPPGTDYPEDDGAPYVDEPDKFEGLNIRLNADKMEVIWEEIPGAAAYDIMRAGSRLGNREKIATVSQKGAVSGYTGWGYTDATPNAAKYENYYFIVAKSGSGAEIPLEKPANPSWWQGNNPNPFINCQWISLEKKIFGEYTYFYDVKYDTVASIAAEINAVGGSMTGAGNDSQMSSSRFAFYLKPGNYAGIANLNVTFYMHVAGLGITPDLTKIGGIRSAGALGSNVTHNFWRSVENFEVTSGTFEWSVSQAAPARRINVPSRPTSYYIGGWASGGFVADSYIGGSVNMGGQQQFYHRNCHFEENWSGGAWNIVNQGSTSGTATDTGWKQNNYVRGGIYTVIEETPLIREKPFLYLDTQDGEYKVFVPGLRSDTGVSWRNANGEITPGVGKSVKIEDFYVAKPMDPAKKLNAKLAAGKHLFLSPGWYEAEVPIHVTRPNTVVLGTGLASVFPGKGNPFGAMFIEDVPGVSVAHVMFDAHYDSTYLIRAGAMAVSQAGKGADHSANPTMLTDIFCRVGGYVNRPVRADVSVQINSNHVIADHMWLWRADHGRISTRTAPHGLIVSGDNVTLYGTFVEHYQKYNTIWFGERGRAYFYQYETPYDGWSHPSPNGTDGATGWAAFKVWNTVNEFYGMAFGMYGVSTGQRAVNAVEAPNKPGVKFEALFTKSLNGGGHQLSVVNGTGNSTVNGPNGNERRVAIFVDGVATIGGSAATTQDGVAIEDEEFSLPSGPVAAQNNTEPTD